MADNIAITPGAGASVATDEASTSGSTSAQHYQRVKLTTGPDGVAVGDASELYPVPVRSVDVNRLLIDILVELRVLTSFFQNEMMPRVDADLLRQELRNEETGVKGHA